MIEVIEQNHVQMPGSVLYTISRSDSLYCKTPHHFGPPANLPTFLVNFSASFEIFYVKIKPQSSPFSYLVWFLRYLHFYVWIRLDRILKKLLSYMSYGNNFFQRKEQRWRHILHNFNMMIFVFRVEKCFQSHTIKKPL